MNYKYHKYANIFPLIEGNEFEELKKDIKQNGLIESVVLYQDQILDGRNRYRACIDTGVTPNFTKYMGDSPIEYVVSLNLKRRHLTASQRAVIALDVLPLLEEEAKKRQATSTGGFEPQLVAKMPQGGTGKAREKAGDVFNVGARYIQDAKKLKEETPEVIEDIRLGKKTISEVTKKIKIERRKKDIAKQRKDIESGEAKLPEGKFEVIVVDPPWQYHDDSVYDPKGFRGTTTYPTMTIEEIKKEKIPFADDCVLWLWTTHKFMRHTFELLDAWGFEEKAILTWVKQKMGIGRWLRSKSEFCIMAVKGKPTIQLTNQTTVLQADATQHSRKPDEFYKMVDELCIGRKLDYFSREKRKGWEVYGLIKK